MRILLIVTMVATSCALQISRHDIRCRGGRRSRNPLSLHLARDLDDVTLVRAKIDILQAVVKDLCHRNKILEKDKTLLLEAFEAKWQESTAIACAAVDAAEARSTTIATELSLLERRHKKAQVYCNLQQLVIQGLLEEL